MRISGWQTYPQFLSLSAKDQTNRVYRIGKWMLNLTVSCWHDRPPDAILSSPSDSLKPTRDARYCFHLPKLGMTSMLVCQREPDELGQHQMENCPTSSSTSSRIPEWVSDTAFHFGIRFRKESHNWSRTSRRKPRQRSSGASMHATEGPSRPPHGDTAKPC